MDPGVVRAITGRPYDSIHFQAPPIPEPHRPVRGVDGAPDQLHPVATGQLMQAGPDQEIPPLRPAAQAIERRGDQAELVPPPVQGPAEQAEREPR